MTREWKITKNVTLKIHEPPLTGDNLGLKTWASSWALAKQLKDMGQRHPLDRTDSTHEDGFHVLELGSGTGLVGLAAAAVWRCGVMLTDLAEICSNLGENCHRNKSMINTRGGFIDYEVLDWEDDKPLSDIDSGRFQVSRRHFQASFLHTIDVCIFLTKDLKFILAADPLYDLHHADILAKTIHAFLRFGVESRVIIEIPWRDSATKKMAQKLLTNLDELEFELLEEGEEALYDDWERNQGDEEVKCWWGIWARRPSSTAVTETSEFVADRLATNDEAEEDEGPRTYSR